MDEFPEITFTIGQAFRQLEADKITPWVFLTAGKMKPIENFNGHTVQYTGVAFEGSPRHVFWNGFIEPFLEAMFIWAFDLALVYARQHRIDVRKVVSHAERCLSNGMCSIYERMQDIDRRLRGKGYPDRVTPQEISGLIEVMKTKLQTYYESALRSHFADNSSEPPLFWMHWR